MTTAAQGAPFSGLSSASAPEYIDRMRGALALALVCVTACLAAAGTAVCRARRLTNPNDPVWNFEWGPRLTRAADLWQFTTGNPSIVIAVVDTGLTPLPDLTQVIPGWDIVGNDTNTGDDFGHGTWVSSVIGAMGDNNIGMAGYCWRCSIMPVRVAAGRTGALAPAVAAGIRWAVDHGARIINVSLASNGYDFDELGAVEYANEHGVLVVGAAGNTGNTSPLYPGGYPGVLAVAGTDQNDSLYELVDPRLLGSPGGSRMRRGARRSCRAGLRVWLVVLAARGLRHRRAAHVARPELDCKPDHGRPERDGTPGRRDRRRPGRRLGSRPLPRTGSREPPTPVTPVPTAAAPARCS